jgi:hypothetical protein
MKHEEPCDEATKAAFMKIMMFLSCHSFGEKQLKAAFWALAFETGVARQVTSCTPSHMAKRLGISRAYISYLRKMARETMKTLNQTNLAK